MDCTIMGQWWSSSKACSCAAGTTPRCVSRKTCVCSCHRASTRCPGANRRLSFLPLTHTVGNAAHFWHQSYSNIFKTEYICQDRLGTHIGNLKAQKAVVSAGEENDPFPIINGRLYALASDVGWENAHDTGEQGFCLMRRINNASSFGPIFWLVRNEPQKTHVFASPFPHIRIRSLPRQA